MQIVVIDSFGAGEDSNNTMGNIWNKEYDEPQFTQEPRSGGKYEFLEGATSIVFHQASMRGAPTLHRVGSAQTSPWILQQVMVVMVTETQSSGFPTNQCLS